MPGASPPEVSTPMLFTFESISKISPFLNWLNLNTIGSKGKFFLGGAQKKLL
jgi:hypothetical protein